MRDLEATLIGYVLNALDDSERLQVEEYLQSHPEAQAILARVEQALHPLQANRELEDTPPPDLASRTLAAIDAHYAAPLPYAPVLSGYQRQEGGGSWWRRADVLVAGFLIVIVSSLAAIWATRARAQSEVIACQDNMRNYHQRLVEYAQNHDDRFPQIAQEGPLAFAGANVAILNDAHLFDTGVQLFCDPSQKKVIQPVSQAQLRDWHQNNPEKYREAIQQLGGSYAYALGYRDGNQLRGLRMNAGQDLMPILADAPQVSSVTGVNPANSPNHDGRGQNVLFVNGQVQFVTNRSPRYPEDDIYLNQMHQVGAGIHSRDTVLGASYASPGSR